MSDVEQADQLEGALHPRESAELYGHEGAETEFLSAYRGGRLHHAWLMGGLEGIGKATLCYRIARFLLAYPKPDLIEADRKTLFVPQTHPAFHAVASGTHPDLVVLNRSPDPEKQMKVPTIIPVDYVRKVVGFFGGTASAGGWRICIVDSADEMNLQSMNALLKVLEEPPAKSIFLIVNHVAGWLLPTIRSRCRALMLQPLQRPAMSALINTMPEADNLSDQDKAVIIATAEGSVREAVKLVSGDELALVTTVQDQLKALPKLDYMALHALGEQMSLRDDGAFDLLMKQIQLFIHNHVRMQCSQGARALAQWAEVWEKAETGAAKVRAYNLDRKPFVFSLFGWLAELKSA